MPQKIRLCLLSRLGWNPSASTLEIAPGDLQKASCRSRQHCAISVTDISGRNVLGTHRKHIDRRQGRLIIFLSHKGRHGRLPTDAQAGSKLNAASHRQIVGMKVILFKALLRQCRQGCPPMSCKRASFQRRQVAYAQALPVRLPLLSILPLQ